MKRPLKTKNCKCDGAQAWHILGRFICRSCGGELSREQIYEATKEKKGKPTPVSDPSQPYKIALFILALLGASYVSWRVIGLLVFITELLQK